MKAIAVILAAIGGVLLNRAGAWIVHHDSINYSLPLPVRIAAETAFALGPVLWVAGIILATPLALGWVRGVGAFWKLVGLKAFAYFALLCGHSSLVPAEPHGKPSSHTERRLFEKRFTPPWQLRRWGS
jgi:hypothetical protein